MLSDYTTIELGEHDGYTLTAKAKKNSTGTKVQVQPSVVFRKLAEGGTEALSENTSFLFYTVRGPLKKDYFTEEDVFKYILDKTAGIAINTDPAVFASSFYAAAKTGVTPANLFTDAFKAPIKKYTELYRTKDTDKHLKLDITYGIVQPKDKTNREQKAFSNHPLLRVDENGYPTVDNPFDATSNPFNLSVSGSGIHPSSHLGYAVFGTFANIVLCIAVS